MRATAKATLPSNAAAPALGAAEPAAALVEPDARDLREARAALCASSFS